MKRSPGAIGFNGRGAPSASPHLIRAVAASLALSAFLTVAITLLAIKVSIAMPLPA
ncbi:MAG: hypothetical protein JOY90_35690 [Bradyrhizobium sp.]|uniref:hypothetical protein n=1 Tax=Bradyrhizobium sp. TaxID=376 RepID=UPI001D272DE2|nr:hypothetical protein [Bradyrhizobium sp.]MBV9565758.1 hypothetical protein [Bradyrhizobium sp.]